MPTRRQFLGTLATLGLGAATWSYHRDHTVELSRRRVSLGPPSGPPIRLLHLSDLHYSDCVPLEHIRRAFDLALAERPDIICITGDFVTDRAPDPGALVRELSRLAAAAPTLACLGNHDGGLWRARRGGPATPAAVREMVEAAHVEVLDGATCERVLQGRTVFFTGVADLWSAPIDPRGAGFGRESAPRVVLAHNPDTKDELAGQAWRLMLSGHTHGGQIRLPLVGGALTAPVRDARFIEGLHPWEGRYLHVSRGVGCLYGLRINCPPEITVLELA